MNIKSFTVKPVVGTNEVRYCEGCDDDVRMSIQGRDCYWYTEYFWACDSAYEDDGDWDGEDWLDVSDRTHTELIWP